MKRRIISLLLVCIMVLGILPVSAFATDGGEQTAPALPKAKANVLDTEELTFALNFTVDKDDMSEEEISALLNYYADYFVDFELSVNAPVTFNAASDKANGFLSGSYGEFGWVNVPTSDVVLKKDESIKIMNYAAGLMNQWGLRQRFSDIAGVVQDFSCGVYFTNEYLTANPDLEVTLKLNIYEPDTTVDYHDPKECPYGEALEVGKYVFKNPLKTVILEIQDNTALENIDPSEGHDDVEDFVVTLSGAVVDGEAVKEIIYNVEPLDAEGKKVSNPEKAITFRLPVPASVTKPYAEVYHDGEYVNTYEIKGEGDGKYVEITAAEFSEFAMIFTNVAPEGGEDETTNIAEVNGVGYPTLAEAIAAADDETVTLLEDIELSEMITVPAGKTITLDLNGCKIIGGWNGSSTTNHIYALSNEGTLTIKDSVGEGEIVSRGIYNYGTLTLESGTIDACDGNGGYAVNNESGSTFIMNGGVVEASLEDDYESSSGGYDATALDVPAGCTATLNGGKITSVTDFTFAISTAGTLNIPETSTVEVEGNHGAISVSGGVTTVNAGTFKVIKDNYTRTDNVTYVSGGELIVNGGTFTGDGDTVSGGCCVCVDGEGTGKVTINDGTFKNSSGGDVWGKTGATTINGGTFENLTETAHVTVGKTIVNGGKTYTKAEDGTMEEKTNVAEVNGTGYETLQDAIDAARTGDTVVLLQDIKLSETVKVNGTVVLDLNGKTITGTDNATSSFALIEIQPGAELTIDDSTEAKEGKITLTSTKNRGWNAYSSVISNQRGKLIVENGTLEHLGGTDMAYGIDNLTNGKGTYAETIINGGTVKSTYRAIRQFLNGVEAQNILTVNGGTIEGANKSIWMQDPSKNANSGTLTVDEKAVLNGDVYLYVTPGSTEWPVEVSIAASAVNGEVLTGNVPEKYIVENAGGTWGVEANPAAGKAAKIGENNYYETLQAAIDAAKTGDTVVLLKDIELTEADCVEGADRKVLVDVVGKDITLNMNGKKISVVHEDAFTNDYVVAVIRVADGAGLTVTGNGTIDVKVLDDNPDIAYMFWKRGTTGHLTVENGTFHMNDSADSMVYTNGNEIVNIKGGTWTLDAYGTRGNREPWIFNVQGAGDNHVTVTGGTFNADINRQHWSNEVVVPETHYTVANADGTWTVKEGAVAYVNEGMTTGPYFVRKNIGYATLADAVNAADDGDTITLLQDLNVGNGITVGHSAAKVITIDLNDHKLTGSGVTLTAFRAGTELTLTNGTVHGNSSGGTLVTTYNGKLILGDDLTVTSGGQASAIKVNGGKLEVPGKNVKVMGGAKGCIILGSEADAKNILISGGTYSAEIPEDWCIEDYGSVKNNDGTWTVQRVKFVLNETIGEKYATLAEAIKAVPKDATVQTLKLLDNTTAKGQFIGHSYAQDVILDLNGFTLSSTDKTLTIYRSGTEVTIMNGTVSGNTTGGTIQVTYGGKLTLGETVTVKSGGSANAIKVDDNSTLIISSETAKVLGGKAQNNRADITASAKAKIEISAGFFGQPVKEAWCVEGKMPNPDKTADGYTVMDATEALIIRENGFFAGTLQEAIENAANNETIKVMKDITVDADDLDVLDGNHTFFKVEGKTITIDLNGKKILADASAVNDKYVVGVFSATNGGNLTLTGNGTVQGHSGATQEAAYLDPAKGNKDYNYKFYTLLVAYDDECRITVENGTYSLDYAGDSLIYTSCNEGVVVNGGTFTLGNLGGIRNGMPWIFNARGQNIRHVVVTGGTFCADIQHQFYPFEVQINKELALKKENGMYTVVPAVAYVTEREWSSAWYTNDIGYATLEEAFAACEGPKTRSGKTSEQEEVHILSADIKDIQIPAGFKGKLVLENVTLNSVSASDKADIEIRENVKVANENGSAITGKVLNISGTGSLTAIGNGDHAYGIGGDETKEINIENVHILDVKGGHVQPLFVNDTKYGKSEPEGGAAIGSGYNGAVITLTNVTIDNAQGGSKAAGIGARFHVGVTINITDCEIKNVEGGNASAGIGGSRVSSGATANEAVTINITDSTITAKGGQAGAGIGSGYDTHCQSNQPICTIKIDGSTINATGGKYAAGVGTGYHNAGLAGEIKNSTVNAASGEKLYKDAYTQAQDIGFGVVDPAREADNNISSITFNGTVIAIPTVR